LGSIGCDVLPLLLEIERKQHFVEAADDVSNIILEVRRYEKNYLLYGPITGPGGEPRIPETGNELLSKIEPESKDSRAHPF